MNTHPTKEDLESPAFNAIWEAIKKWDLDRGDISTSQRCNYAGATGTDVMTILNALRNVNALSPTPNEDAQGESLEDTAKRYADTKLPVGVNPHFKILLANAYKAGRQATQSPVEPYNIIISLIRCVIASKPNEATLHQINRLHKSYCESCNDKVTDAITEMLNPSNDEYNFKIVQSPAPVPELKWVKASEPPKDDDHKFVEYEGYKDVAYFDEIWRDIYGAALPLAFTMNMRWLSEPEQQHKKEGK